MWILGLVLVAVAVVGVVVGQVQRRRWQQLAGAETLTASRLGEEVAAVGQLGGDQFRRPCAVAGAAQPGPDGPLTAKMSQVACVWHRQVVRRRFQETTTDSRGNRRQQTRTTLVSDVSSPLPFTVVDDTGSVLVGPEGAKVDRPECVHKDFSPDGSGASLSAMGITFHVGTGNGTIGFETEEWVIRPGTRLYVLGEATAGPDGVRMGKPGRGRFLISTREKRELTGKARRIQQISMAVAAVALVAGVAVLVVSLL